jgi:hypothetical protein
MSTTKHQAIAAAVLTMTLAACGGGGGGSGASTQTTSSGQNSSTGTSTQASGDYLFSGSAPTVTGTNGQVSIIFSANALRSSSASGTFFYNPGVALASVTQQSAYGGAFTSLNTGSSSIDLTKGSTIADINGAGGYIAIGRWTKGSDTSGGNYTANEGGVYAVGNPLTLTAGTGTLACSAAMSTSPTSASGSVVPGTLTAATATFDKASLTLTNFSATVTIGSDVNATFTKASVPWKGGQLGGGMSTLAEPMGNDPTKPFIALAYGAKVTNTGDINGIVVLSCQ